ncbi:MAG: hypothetical protein ACO3LE_10015 [Bdellovibrionota bacterium]
MPLLASEEKSSNKVEHALSYLPANSAKAIAIFESVSQEDPDFQLVVQELMKLFYREQNWPKFFAFSQYHRVRWGKTNPSEIQLLEALALLRHCQNTLLQALIEELEASPNSFQAELDQIKSLSRVSFEKPRGSKKMPSNIANHFSGTSTWPTKKQALTKAHPAQLRVEVKGLCD